MCLLQKRASLPGPHLTTDGIKLQKEKIKAICDMKSPTNQKGVREFLGMVGYYRKFINWFANAARPMTRLTRKDIKFSWSEECQAGFDYLKTCLTKDPILKYPDSQKRYVVLLMQVIKLQQLSLLRNLLTMMLRSRRCP